MLVGIKSHNNYDVVAKKLHPSMQLIGNSHESYLTDQISDCMEKVL